MHRIIKSPLITASLYPGVPQFARNARTRGVKRKGILYEVEIQKALPKGWKRGQWLIFQDSAGPGYCQLDFYFECADGIVVLESKLSWVPEGHSQLELLYRPVVEKIWGKPMIGLVITKRVTPECKGAIAQNLPSAISAARSVRNVVLHWTGKSSLVPVPRSTPLPQSPLSQFPARA
jgi:hypothetical protein